MFDYLAGDYIWAKFIYEPQYAMCLLHKNKPQEKFLI